MSFPPARLCLTETSSTSAYITLRCRRPGPAAPQWWSTEGAWCPYCNLTLRAYQETLVSELDGRGVALVAVSPQKPDGSLSMQQKNDLTYTVVSDLGNQIAGRLGIVTATGKEARNAQVSLGLDLADINADGTHALPFPTVIIVDAAGSIRWIDVHPDYTTRSEPAQILSALDAALANHQ